MARFVSSLLFMLISSVILLPSSAQAQSVAPLAQPTKSANRDGNFDAKAARPSVGILIWIRSSPARRSG
jgi:hypothetical protein